MQEKVDFLRHEKFSTKRIPNMEKLQKNDDIRRTTRIIQIDEMLRGGS